MAVNRKIANGVGMIGLPGGVQADAAGKIPTNTLARLSSDLLGFAQKINGKLSLGNGAQASQAGNLDAQWLDVVFPSGANTEVEIPHGLLRVPIGYDVCRKDRACDVYDSSNGSWDESRFFLKCSVASATVKLRVY